jgi:hypothetical protein
LSAPPPPTPISATIGTETKNITVPATQTLQFDLNVCDQYSGSGTAILHCEILDSAGNILANTKKTLVIKCAQVHRDPKFVGFDGETYFVRGENGHNYAIISDKHLQLNALFDRDGKSYQHQTYMTQIGLLVGTNYRVKLEANGSLTINDQKYSCSTANFQTSQLRVECATASDRSPVYAISVAEYEITLSTKKQGTIIDMGVSYVPRGDEYTVHGILGQTADRDNVPRQGLVHSQQGEGWIEGTYQDYEVSNILDYDFRFNQFVGLNLAIDQ